MSSSSSMCDYDEFCSYHPLRSYQEPWYDYYQTIGHPLIYYAEVQPSSQRSRSGVRKDPNFFVKAFRWYTQEHRPPLQDREKANAPDFSGFANWLDAKYGQYIQEGQKEPINQLTAPKPGKPKKLLATMKSHFTRRHKIKNDGARQKRSCNSCEYIMKPKDMSIIGSDCRRSNIKAVCSDTQEKRSTIKSVSMTSSRYHLDYQKSIEIVVTEGDINDKPEDNCSCAKTEVLTIFESKPNQVNDVGIGPLPCDPPNVDTVCECRTPVKVDAYTQYDKTKRAPTSLAPQPPVEPAPSKSKVEKHTQDKNKSSVTSVSKESSKLRKAPKMSDISCLCSLERVPTSQPTKSTKSTQECKSTAVFQDVKTKMTQKNVATDAIYGCPCTTPQQAPPLLPTPATTPVVPMPPPPAPVVDTAKTSCLCVIPTPKATPPVIPVAPVIPPPSAPIVTPVKTGCLCSIRVNETMQTSDTSIRLDDEVIKYPFFMKIVRADKLITDC